MLLNAEFSPAPMSSFYKKLSTGFLSSCIILESHYQCENSAFPTVLLTILPIFILKALVWINLHFSTTNTGKHLKKIDYYIFSYMFKSFGLLKTKLLVVVVIVVVVARVLSKSPQILPPECWNYICVLASPSIAVNKYPNITEGGQGWNLETGTAAEAVEDHCLLACSSQLIQKLPSRTQDHQPRGSTPPPQ